MNKIFNCTDHKLQIPNIVKSDGVYVYDENGKKYMDLESGVWCLSLGHKNKRINDTIKKQIESITHAGFCYSNNIVQEASESILSITGFKEGKCVFLCSGSEAIELSRQMARELTGKNRSMTFHDSYLGSYSSVTDRSRNWFIFDWKECEACPDRESCRISCDKLRKIPNDLSEFIFEPGSSSGFVRFPPRSLIKNIVTIVRINGGKVIANEVTTGIGRTGKWFGYNHYEIEPDMVAIGKGIGNGYPVSVTAINSQTVQELENSCFGYAQSHQNDPLGAAIVNEVIKIIKEDDLITKAEAKGSEFIEMVKSLKNDDRIVDVRGRGLMFGVDISDDNSGDILYKELIKEGYIVCNRNSLFRIDPPLIISNDQFSSFIKEFKRILDRK